MVKITVRFAILFTLFFALFSQNAFSQGGAFFYQIHEINLHKPGAGIYSTEGFVVKTYTCPACPEGAVCKPCMGDNIVISENNKMLKGFDLTAKELILFFNDVKQLEAGKKYKFLIKVTDKHTTNEEVSDIELVDYIQF